MAGALLVLWSRTQLQRYLMRWDSPRSPLFRKNMTQWVTAWHHHITPICPMPMPLYIPLPGSAQPWDQLSLPSSALLLHSPLALESPHSKSYKYLRDTSHFPNAPLLPQDQLLCSQQPYHTGSALHCLPPLPTCHY